MFKRKNVIISILVLVILAAAAAGVGYYIMTTYTVRQVYVE